MESVSCPSYTEAVKAGEPITVEVSSTLADGLAVPKVGELAFKVRCCPAQPCGSGPFFCKFFFTKKPRNFFLPLFYQVAHTRVDRTVLVTEKDVAVAVLRLMEVEKGMSGV